MFVAKMRWRIERDYQDLKQDFGLGHYIFDTVRLEDCHTQKKAAPKAAFFMQERYQAVKLEPQPQVLVAFGFLITNCAPSRSSL